MNYKVPAYRCVLVRESSRDMNAQKKISSSDAAIKVSVQLLKDSPNEQLIVFCLDTKNRIIGYQVATVGTLDASLVHPREIFRSAILLNASSIIIAHNHPSGDLTPSKEDYAVLNRLDEAGQVIGIDCLDSIIVNHETGVSMR